MGKVNTYKQRKVLVTGHTGFKGSWLSIWLKEMGADVIGYALEPNTIPSNFMASRLEGRLAHCTGDIRDLEGLNRVIEKHQPEFVFHLAAQPLVRLSYAEPKLTLDTNIGGTINVLEAVRRNPCIKVLVNITSDKCYDNREWVWGYRESDPMGGRDPYSASKGAAELVFNAYLQSFFGDSAVGLASVRAGNVVGGGDWAEDRLIPDCVRALTRKEPIGIRNPHATRPWQHVLEPLAGYIWLGALLREHPEKYRGAWNFGPDSSEHLNVGEVVGRFVESWGSGQWLDLSDPNAVHEASALRLCCDKACSLLKWRSVLNVSECLEMTAEWYRIFYENPGIDMYPTCIKQIVSYTEKAREQKIAWAL